MPTVPSRRPAPNPRALKFVSPTTLLEKRSHSLEKLSRHNNTPGPQNSPSECVGSPLSLPSGHPIRLSLIPLTITSVTIAVLKKIISLSNYSTCIIFFQNLPDHSFIIFSTKLIVTLTLIFSNFLRFVIDMSMSTPSTHRISRLCPLPCQSQTNFLQGRFRMAYRSLIHS